MKNSKLRALLKATEHLGVDDDSFVNLNVEVNLNYRGGHQPSNSTCNNNGACDGNATCSNNDVCNGNLTCSGNGGC